MTDREMTALLVRTADRAARGPRPIRALQDQRALRRHGAQPVVARLRDDTDPPPLERSTLHRVPRIQLRRESGSCVMPPVVAGWSSRRLPRMVVSLSLRRVE